jgi:hypothetical protein
VSVDSGVVSTNAVTENSGFGISIAEEGLATDNSVISSGGFGLNIAPPVGYSNNIIDLNNGGNFNPQVSSAVEIGTNVCGGDTTCP